METRGRLSPMSAMRKQGAPLDFQKGFVENIQKIKNGLCPSSVNYVDSFPPRGSLEKG